MVLYLRIFICISFFVFNTFTFCKSIIKTETSFLTTVQLPANVNTVNTKVPSVVWPQIQVSNPTRDWNFKSELNNSLTFHDSTAVKNVSKRLAIISNRNLTTTNRNNSNLIKTNHTTTIKPKSPKSGNATTKPSLNITKPTKFGQKNNLKYSNVTIWPKPDKRLSNTVQKTANVNTSNHTDEIEVMSDFKTKYPINKWKEHGFYTDDYMNLINIHWFKFEPPNATSHYILGLLYTVIMVLGCFGNSLVIFMYIKCKSLQTPANVLIMNLAVSDFIMLAKTPVFIYNSYYQGPTLGKLGCQIYGFFGGLTGTVSIMTLAAISLDRYYVIVHPLNAAVKTTKQRARVWIGLIWMYGFLFSIIPVMDLGYNRYVPEGYLTSCSFDYLTDDNQEKGFILVFFTAAWCIPFTTISYCYVKILRAVWVTSEMTASRYGQEEEKRKTEIRLGYVVVGVILLWFVSWTPYAMVALLGVFDQKEYITPLSSMIPALFCKAASCMDPWIYAITHPRFKNELTKLMSKKKTRKLERDYGMKKSWGQSHSNKSGAGLRNFSSSEDECVEEVIVVIDPDDKKMIRQGSTSSHKTEETKALETKFPPTRQESLKYMPPSWYKLPRTTSKSSIMLDAKLTGDNNNK
ncbi:melanopsin-like isoform X1 [Rhopalosiphum maidis]|uniref:melanopsin-like isoform X1 n=2 Tax=Rhopalosiphum maidis TaxID=43146 RepID=UPI000EFEC7EE|nr:melanopsin-like isoform X1 [Rhopalosiphum maidis]